MKKAALFLVISIVIGWSSQAVQAQEQKSTHEPKVRITIHQNNGETHVFEYDSREEMLNDERLKALKVPLIREDSFGMAFSDAITRDRLIIDAARLRLTADSLRSRQFRVPFDSSLLTEIDRTNFMVLRDKEGGFLDALRLLDSADVERFHQDMKVFRFQGAPFSDDDAQFLKQMPEDIQKMLEARGLSLDSRHQVICFSLSDSIPVPPVPPVPPMPTEVPNPPLLPEQAPEAPDADLEAPTAPAEAPQWLEEFTVFPTPAAGGQVQLRFKSRSKGAVVLRLIDLNGKVVYEEKIPDARNSIDKTLKAPNGARGMMVLQIQQGDNTYSRRIILE